MDGSEVTGEAQTVVSMISSNAALLALVKLLTSTLDGKSLRASGFLMIIMWSDEAIGGNPCCVAFEGKFKKTWSRTFLESCGIIDSSVDSSNP